MNTTGVRVRQRNRRGEGARLRDDILAAATAILEATGSEESVTLRGIARHVGIAAPSIARHFASVTDVIDAVVAAELQVLADEITAARAHHDDPVERLVAMCAAYVRFGRERPARYRVLVGRHFVDDWEDGELQMEVTNPLMGATIAMVVEAVQACIEAGHSSSSDPLLDTYLLWFGLHGLVTVPSAITSIDWPDRDLLLEAVITRTTLVRRTA